MLFLHMKTLKIDSELEYTVHRSVFRLLIAWNGRQNFACTCLLVNEYRQSRLLPVRLDFSFGFVHCIDLIRTEWYSEWNLDTRYRHNLYETIYSNVRWCWCFKEICVQWCHLLNIEMLWRFTRLVHHEHRV